MFDLNVGSVGSVNVISSDNGGLSNDQIADMLATKLIYISDEAPDPIRLQAEAFRDRFRLEKKNVLVYATRFVKLVNWN